MGEKTVAIDAFEGNNLVLVDEGHRGASGREDGAVDAGPPPAVRAGLLLRVFGHVRPGDEGQSNKALEQEYAKCILFDYSYKYFYRDGFGKDYRILNLADDRTRTNAGCT